MSIPLRLTEVRRRLAQACVDAGRAPETVTLVAVSKTQPVLAIEQALAAGQAEFGENYVQEALAKLEKIPREGVVWHFIGPVQSNKTRDIAGNFDWAHGVDRLKIAQRLSAQRPAWLPPLNVCVQVNIADEARKSGVTPEAAGTLCHEIAGLPRLRLRGLMAIPEPPTAGADVHAPFRRMRLLYDSLRLQGLELDTLSMGMSEDFETAIAEGATLVRIGSAIFGPRA